MYGGEKQQRLEQMWQHVQKIFNQVKPQDRHRVGAQLAFVKTCLDQMGIELAELLADARADDVPSSPATKDADNVAAKKKAKKPH